MITYVYHWNVLTSQSQRMRVMISSGWQLSLDGFLSYFKVSIIQMRHRSRSPTFLCKHVSHWAVDPSWNLPTSLNDPKLRLFHDYDDVAQVAKNVASNLAIKSFTQRLTSRLNDMSCLMAKQTKWHVCPAKPQIRPVWSESSLSAWRTLGSLATHWAHSEDSDQTGRSESSLGAQSFCWFCHEAAHISVRTS